MAHASTHAHFAATLAKLARQLEREQEVARACKAEARRASTAGRTAEHGEGGTRNFGAPRRPKSAKATKAQGGDAARRRLGRPSSAAPRTRATSCEEERDGDGNGRIGVRRAPATQEHKPDSLALVRATYGTHAALPTPSALAPPSAATLQQRKRADADIAALRARVEAATRMAMDEELRAQRERQALTSRMGWDNVRARVFDAPAQSVAMAASETFGGAAATPALPPMAPSVSPEVARAAAAGIRAAQDALLSTLADRQRQAHEAAEAQDAHRNALAAAAREAALRIVAATLMEAEQAGGVAAKREQSLEERRRELEAHADYVRRRMKAGAGEATILRRALDGLRRRADSPSARIFACPDAGYGEYLRACFKSQGWLEATGHGGHDNAWQVCITRKAPSAACVPGQVIPQLPQLRAISTKGGLAMVLRKRAGAQVRTYDLSNERQNAAFVRDYRNSTAHAMLARFAVGGSNDRAADCAGWASAIPERWAVAIALRHVFAESNPTTSAAILRDFGEELRASRIDKGELSRAPTAEEHMKMHRHHMDLRGAGSSTGKPPSFVAYYGAHDSVLVTGEAPPEIVVTLYVVDGEVKASLLDASTVRHADARRNVATEAAALRALCDAFLGVLASSSPHSAMNGTENIWVCKPIAAARGEGIQVCDSLNDILRTAGACAPPTAAHASGGAVRHSGIVQKYLERPAVDARGHKVDLRVWVACLSGLTAASGKPEAAAYVYDNMLVRVAANPHTLDPASMTRARGAPSHGTPHLCNRSLRDDGAAAEAYDLDAWLDNRASALEKERPPYAFVTSATRARVLQKQRDHIYAQIHSQVADALHVGAPSLFARDELPSGLSLQGGVTTGLELLGFDFLIDTDDCCHLLEVNEGPDLRLHGKPGQTCNAGDEVKAAMMRDFVSLCGLAVASAERDARNVGIDAGIDEGEPSWPERIRGWARVVS